MTWQDFQRLKPVAPSHGHDAGDDRDAGCSPSKGGPHFGSPDKDPAVRLRVLEDAGRSNVPFTTGILIGIGETLAERADSIFAIRRVAREYGGIQEVIVQNFRAKPDTKMRGMPDAELDDLAATIAVARLRPRPVGPRSRRRRTSIGDEYQLILGAGIDDWGGVSPLTPDHVNPERPWPQIDELAERTAAAGLHAARSGSRSTRPTSASRGSTRALAAHVAALADPATGLAREGALPARAALAGAGRRLGRRRPAARTCTSRSTRRAGPGTAATTSPRSTATGTRSAARIDARPPARAGPAGAPPVRGRRAPWRAPARLPPRCARPSATRPAHRRPGAGPARRRRRRTWTRWPRSPTPCAATSNGDDVTYVVTRNINFTNVCYTGCRFCAFAQRRTDADAYTLSLDQVGDRAEEAWAGRRHRGVHAGRHPSRPARAPRTSTSPPRSSAAARRSTCTRSRRWR